MGGTLAPDLDGGDDVTQDGVRAVSITRLFGDCRVSECNGDSGTGKYPEIKTIRPASDPDSYGDAPPR